MGTTTYIYMEASYLLSKIIPKWFALSISYYYIFIYLPIIC